MPRKKITEEEEVSTSECPQCLGKGRISDKESCEDCQGTGVKK